MFRLFAAAAFLIITSAACSSSPEERFSPLAEGEETAGQMDIEFPLNLDPRKELDQYSHTNWQEGLPQNSVQAIVQCQEGYLWLGTQEGMVRFDGIRFNAFNRSNTPGFTNNDIAALVEGDEGELWAGTYGGGIIRLKDKGAVAYTTDDGLSSNTVTSLAPDGRGGIWIGTSDSGVDYLTGGRFLSYTTAQGLPSDRIRSLLVDMAGNVWAGTSAGLAVLQRGELDSFAGVSGLAGDDVTALAEGPAGVIWAGTNAGLNRVYKNRIETYTTADGLCNNSIQSLHVDREGNVWIGTIGGLSRFRDGRFSSFTSQHGLPSDNVASLLVDRDGSLWIGTHGGGLNQLSEGKVSTFTTFHGLSNNFIYTVAPARDGGMWAGSYSGDIDRYENGRFHQVLSGSLLGTIRIRTLMEDRSGSLWIGTDESLYRYAGGQLTTFSTGEGLPDSPVRVVSEDREGTIWVGTDGDGLYHLQDGILVPFGEDLGFPPNSAVRTIYQDHEGDLWIGTYSGLSVLRDGRFTTYTTSDGLSHNFIRTLHESNDGTLWIGTYGGGLNRYKDGGFNSYTSRDGLVSDSIYQILEDDDGNLWMSCNLGIFAVSIQDLDDFTAGRRTRIECMAFRESDGMRSRECNGGHPAGLELPGESTLWFPTLRGIAVIDPVNMPINITPPRVVVEAFIVDNEEIDLSSVPVLPPRRKRLELHYTALSFVSPEKVRYRYRLEGFETDWVEAGGNRIAQYTRVPPGDYRFRVIAANSDKVWNETGAFVVFRLQYAFYETIWFPLASILTLLALTYMIYRRRIHSLRRRELILQEKVEEALAEVRVLSGMLPICSHCKKVRDDKGYWSQIEHYIREHSEAVFSHGLCPDCMQKHYPEYAEKIKRRHDSQDSSNTS